MSTLVNDLVEVVHLRDKTWQSDNKWMRTPDTTLTYQTYQTTVKPEKQPSIIDNLHSYINQKLPSEVLVTT